jgi:hypothetical protein
MKSISEIIKIMDFNSVEIVEYTQKCIAVIGATKPIKDDLKALRGKWNSNLTINGASSGGWIFPLTRRDDVVAMLIRLKFKTKEEEEEEEEEEETQKRMDRQRKKEKAERKQKRAERRAERQREKEELEQKQKIAEERADRKQKRADRRAERQRKTEEEEEEDQQKIADEHKLFFLSVVMWMISMLIIMGNYINQKSMSKEMILV